MRDEFEEGLAELRRGIEVIRAGSQTMFVPAYLGRLALGSLAARDDQAASVALAEAFVLAGQTGECTWDAELRRIEGILALKRR